jgi:hypothetical protein
MAGELNSKAAKDLKRNCYEFANEQWWSRPGNTT